MTPAVLLNGNGTLFSMASVDLDRSAAALGAGVTIGRGNWTAFVSYDAHVAGNWMTQEAKAGVRVIF